ncbi:MAG: hypothetical protein L6Q76_04950 [Polyangiaceae bacterium]|nr:hypothetical protein [Polyangiaceae bacterium]
MTYLSAKDLFSRLIKGTISTGSSEWTSQSERQRISAYTRYELEKKPKPLSTDDLVYGLANNAFVGFGYSELRADPLWMSASSESRSWAYNDLWKNRENFPVNIYIGAKRFRRIHPPKLLGCPTGECKSGMEHITLIAMSFLSDHHKMKDNGTSWVDSGNLYGKPDWTPAHANPVSHSMGERVEIQLKLSVGPPSASEEEGIFHGTSPTNIVFTTSPIRVAPDGMNLTMSSEPEPLLPQKVQKLTFGVDWWVEGTSVQLAPDQTSNTLYVTMGVPEDGGDKEAGITHKRMETAVGLVGGIGSLDPHTIVKALMDKVPEYTLVQNPNVPPELDHPKYFKKDAGGAWPIADWMKYYAECQAIVRFVLAVIKQVGCSGDAELVTVWAEPHVDGGKTAIEKVNGSGLRNYSKTEGEETWYAALVDKKPVLKHIYQRIDNNKPNYIGLNSFEACLRLSHAGVTKYYGGGAGTYDSADEVLKAFHALCWVKLLSPNEMNQFTEAQIMEIVHSYR